MSLGFYMDVHVPAAISAELIRRGVDVLTSQEDGTTRLADPDLLDRARELHRVLVTRDEDFLAEGAQRQRTGLTFSGIIFAPQQRVPIGRFIEDLEVIHKFMDIDAMQSRVIHLPLPDSYIQLLRAGA